MRANRRMTTLAGRTAVIDSLRRLANEAVGYGITTIQAMANSVPAAELQNMLGEASAPIRWRVIRFPVALREDEDRESFAPLQRQPSPLVTISGTKWILDGTPIERLAAMNGAYADRSGWTGRLNLSPADIEATLRHALSAADQPLFHIAGDRGIDELFSAMERLAGPERWQPLRVRIEHGEFLTATRIASAKRLGIINVQNPSHFTIRDEMRARYGIERATSAQAVKSLVESGVPFALGADGPLNPFLNMLATFAQAMSRTRPTTNIRPKAIGSSVLSAIGWMWTSLVGSVEMSRSLLVWMLAAWSCLPIRRMRRAGRRRPLEFAGCCPALTRSVDRRPTPPDRGRSVRR